MRLRRRRFCALAAASYAAAHGCQVAAQAPAQFAAPLHLLRTGDIGGLPVVELELGGQRGRWLVDSGSSAALVAPALAQRLQLRRLSPMRVAMAGGVHTLERYRLPPLPGANAPEGLDAFALDPQQLLGAVGARLDGALGAPWLRARISRFDLARRELHWSSVPSAPPPDAAVLPLRWDAGLPVLRLAIGDRPHDEFVFDTGNAGALVIFAARARSLLDRGISLPQTTVRELGGSVSARYARIARLSAPGWVARQVPAALEAGDAARRGAHFDRLAGSLGLALFEPGAVTLDGPGDRLIVELPGLPEPPPLPGGFGLRLHSDDSLTVSAVIATGPAAAAGVQVGDQVQAIDGADARQWSAAMAWDALAGREAAVLQVWRNQASHRIALRRERFFPLLSP